MEHAKELFILTISIYLGMYIVGNHILKKLQEISDKLGATNNLIRDGIDKLDEIELNM